MFIGASSSFYRRSYGGAPLASRTGKARQTLSRPRVCHAFAHVRSIRASRQVNPNFECDRNKRIPLDLIPLVMAKEVSPVLIRQAVWSARIAQFDNADKISVRNLEVTVNAGVDVWGRQKKQRALITVTLHLAQSFDSAAEADALDRSTVHYGKLSKDVQSCINTSTTWTSTAILAETILKQIMETKGDTNLLGTEIDITYPKSSMLGDGAGYCLCSTHEGEERGTSTVLYLRNVQIPCLIGVNSNERTAKQPVVVNLWIDCLNPSRTEDYPELEAVVVNVGDGSRGRQLN